MTSQEPCRYGQIAPTVPEISGIGRVNCVIESHINVESVSVIGRVPGGRAALVLSVRTVCRQISTKELRDG
jgi:hypothetical protein